MNSVRINKTKKAARLAALSLSAVFLMGTAHATQRYLLDVCGLVTVNGQPTSNVVVTAFFCHTNEVVMFGEPTVSFDPPELHDGMTNNYHLVEEVFFGPADQYGTYSAPVYLTYMYKDCPIEIVTCEEVAAQHAVTDKPTFDVDIQCFMDGGDARTPGYWQSKHGARLIKKYDLLPMLNECCLRDAEGNDADFANFRQFRSWLKQRNAENMAYQLSGHLAAMKLNIAVGYVDSGDMIYAPGCSDDEGDYVSIGSIVDKADEALCEDGTTFAGDENRDYQECLKNALDAANNNENWVEL